MLKEVSQWELLCNTWGRWISQKNLIVESTNLSITFLWCQTVQREQIIRKINLHKSQECLPDQFSKQLGQNYATTNWNQTVLKHQLCPPQ